MCSGVVAPAGVVGPDGDTNPIVSPGARRLGFRGAGSIPEGSGTARPRPGGVRAGLPICGPGRYTRWGPTTRRCRGSRAPRDPEPRTGEGAAAAPRAVADPGPVRGRRARGRRHVHAPDAVPDRRRRGAVPVPVSLVRRDAAAHSPVPPDLPRW